MTHQERDIVLVTGGYGLVGRCLADELLEHGDKFDREFIFLSSKDGDLTSRDETRRIFDKYRPNYVIHLAAKVGGLYANMQDTNGQFYELNKKLNENVLALSHEFNVKRCISFLSTCIFADQIEEYPLDETKVHLGPPHESNHGYAMAKRQVDLLNRHYNSLRESDDKTKGSGLFFSIIPTNIYGPHDNFHLHEAHVVPGLIHRAYQQCMSCMNQAGKSAHQRLPVCGSGKPLRQFIFGRDLAKLILWSLDEFTDSDEPLIVVCPGKADGLDYDEVSIGQVAEMICKIFNDKFQLSLEPHYDLSKSDGQFKKTASNKKLKRLNPGFEFTKLESGLQTTIDWFCSHYPRVRGV